MSQLFYRVVPHPKCESLNGYLMRVAHKNHLSGPATVLRNVFGTRDAPMLRDADRLAEYCRCYADEFLGLIGFWRHAGPDGHHLYVNGTWVTKDQFDAARYPAVCPHCLSEEPYLRGLWDFSFYTTCHIHSTQLRWDCPACRRKLDWTRRLPAQCNCGSDLRHAPVECGSEASILLASLIARAVDPSIAIQSQSLKNLPAVMKLAPLTLDALFKVVWLLGHLIPLAASRGTLHGRIKPSRPEAEAIIERSLYTLRFWPDPLLHDLDCLRDGGKGTGVDAYLSNRIGAVRKYLSADEDDPELSFLRTAFEQGVSHIWRERHRRRDHTNGWQLELPFSQAAQVFEIRRHCAN